MSSRIYGYERVSSKEQNENDKNNVVEEIKDYHDKNIYNDKDLRDIADKQVKNKK